MTIVKLFNTSTTSYIEDSILKYHSGQLEYEGLNLHDAKVIIDLILKLYLKETE